jgi:hypothetical protein
VVCFVTRDPASSIGDCEGTFADGKPGHIERFDSLSTSGEGCAGFSCASSP